MVMIMTQLFLLWCLILNTQAYSSAPGRPKDVSVKGDSPTMVILSVLPPDSDGGRSILGYRVEYDGQFQDFRIGEEICIENLRPSTIYIFQIRAGNEVGVGDFIQYVYTTQSIRSPYPIVITSEHVGKQPNSYKVKWEKPRTGGLPINDYLFKYRHVEVIEGSWNLKKPLERWTKRVVREDISQPLQSYSLENLQPNSSYEIQVVVRNEIGYSQPNQEFIFRTAAVQDVSGKPKAVTVKKESPTMVVFSVLSPDTDGGRSILGYRVEYDGLLQDFRIGEEIHIENLRPSTIYIFQIRAVNDAGVGDFIQYVYTTESIRSPYPIVITSQHEGEHPNSYSVKWEKPRTGGLPIKEYQFKYRRVEVIDGSWNLKKPLEHWTIIKVWEDISQPLQSYNLENLQPNSFYQVQVMAQNDIGYSQPNQEFIFRTAAGRFSLRQGSDDDWSLRGALLHFMEPPAEDDAVP